MASEWKRSKNVNLMHECKGNVTPIQAATTFVPPEEEEEAEARPLSLAAPSSISLTKCLPDTT